LVLAGTRLWMEGQGPVVLLARPAPPFVLSQYLLSIDPTAKDHVVDLLKVHDFGLLRSGCRVEPSETTPITSSFGYPDSGRKEPPC
jgi:hypothetical protein